MTDKDDCVPWRFKPLVIYNSEVARGLVHTEEWQEIMTALQMEFDDWDDPDASTAQEG